MCKSIYNKIFLFLCSGWLSERGLNADFEMLSTEEINNYLKYFYAEARTKKGENYSKSALVGMRAAVGRHLNSPPFERKVNITKDSDFMSSNHVLMGQIKNQKRKGLDITSHKEPLSEGDLNKLYSTGVLSTKSPLSLLRKVWFEITLHFGRRGAEGLNVLTKTSFQIKTDDTGCKYVTMAYNEADKTHKGLDNKESQKNPGMFEIPSLGEECPVAAFALYVSKLNPESNAFFQHPTTRHINKSDAVWYTKQPLGLNSLKIMMSKISEAAGLSQRYTNHCVRGTTATILGHAGLPSLAIMSVTGHRNESSLRSYINSTSVAQKRQMSTLLQATATGIRSIEGSSCLALPAPQGPTHVNPNVPVETPINNESLQLAVHKPTPSDSVTPSANRFPGEMNINNAVSKQAMDMSNFFNLQGATVSNPNFNIHIHN